MALDNDPAGGFRTKDEGSFWFGSDANPDAVVMDTAGNLTLKGELISAVALRVGAGAVLTFGAAGDVNLYRIDANTLGTDDGFTTFGPLAAAGKITLSDVSGTPDTPASGVVLYSDAGVLKCIDPNGTVTQIAPPAE